MKKRIIVSITAFFIFINFTGCGTISNLDNNEQDLTFSSNYEHSRSDINLDEANSNYSDVQSVAQAGNSLSVESVTEPEPEIITENTVKLNFIAVGDNLIHTSIIDDAKSRTGGYGYNFGDIYKGIESYVKSADIAFINSETPMAGEEFGYSGYPMFNTPQENGHALVDMGFNVVNIANNHMLDKGEKGYKNTIDFWKEQKVLLLGGFTNQDDFEELRILEKDGVSIAFLSYTYGTNGLYLPKGSEMVIPLMNLDDESTVATVERQIKAARTQADLLIVVLHWGHEDWFEPSPSQRNAAQMMVDNNVDVILGMHPHVLQEVKWVDRPDGGRTLLAYSIGNFISGMLYARNMLGGLLGFDILKTTKSTGETNIRLDNAKLIPLMTHYSSSWRDFNVIPFEDYTKELAERHGCIKYDSKMSYNYIKNLVTDIIAPEFLSDFYTSSEQ